MKDKKIVVALKCFNGEINPFDGAALECALQTGAKEIIALSMSPPSALSALRALTRLGVKVVMISDSVYTGSDTQATGLVLSEAVKRIQPDFVFCGRQSVDGDTGQIPPMLSQRLGFDLIEKVMAIDGKFFLTRAGMRLMPKAKSVITFEKCQSLRFPSLFSMIQEVELWDNSVLKINVSECGLQGSATRVLRSYESRVGRRNCAFFSVEKLSELIERALNKQRAEEIQKTGEKFEKVYYIGKIDKVAQNLAMYTERIDCSSKTAEQIADFLTERKAKTVLWEDSDELKTLAARVAVLTGAGLCADCISFRLENRNLIMTRPAFGGNITADIVSTGKMAFATVRTVKKQEKDVIFSVGKGAITDLGKIKLFSEKYNAELCCSRPVADAGILPYEGQVGLTGKIVSPKVYVAFGVSGAVQHTCAIASAGTVIAVNIDKNARIFDYADYGIIAEVKNVKL